MTIAAAAPSDICDELPAVTVPFMWNAGLSAASASSEVSARGPSSILKMISVRFGLLPLGVVKLTGTGTISSSNLPASMAAKAFLWLSTENWSACSREMPQRTRQALGGQSHGEIGVGIVRDQPGVGRDLVAAHGNHGHGLDAAGDDDLGSAGHDALGRHGNRLQARGAEAVDGHRRDLDRQARRAGRRCGRRSCPARLRAWRSRG